MYIKKLIIEIVMTIILTKEASFLYKDCLIVGIVVHCHKQEIIVAIKISVFADKYFTIKMKKEK